MAIPTPPSASQELRADNISASTDGRPVPIALDHTTVGDVTTLHAMTQADVVDKIFLTLWNLTALAIEVSIIISPADDTNASNVDAATVTLLVPPKVPFEVPPFYARFITGNGYTVAAYVTTGDVNDVLVQGRYSRLTQGDLTA